MVAACLLGPALAHATMVRLFTVLGPVDIELFDAAAPATVANFLSYVRSSAYDNSFIHRSVPGFIVQGGGYTWVEGGLGPVKVPAGPPVVNEFSPTRSNLRATVAMAKLAGNPNSATTEWFVNLANNAANLDNQNGGFTVFGRVTAPGMAVVDALAALRRVNAGGAYSDLPIVGEISNNTIVRANVATVTSMRVLDAPPTDADRIFDYLEAVYAEYLKPPGTVSSTGLGYYYRYYPASDSYIGVADGVVYYLVPAVNSDINRYATMAEVLPAAQEAGY
ncbi:MAG: peptidylprolyl isomerase [Rubrivivax sp.]|nr:peptidylprolyl isomerase [Rubrivivax sp.]